MKNKNTIFALSTFFGQSALAVIRISGSRSKFVAKKLCNLKSLKPRYAYLCKITDSYGEVFDEGLVIYFKKPNSFTGEDILEIQTHGSIAIINKLIEELKKIKNLRLAEAGEFSKRAYLNNKNNLLHYEGINNLIAAESDNQRKIANKQAFGQKKNPIQTWKKEIQMIKAVLNAQIEFVEEINYNKNNHEIVERLVNLTNSIEHAISQFKIVSKLKYGQKIVLVGPPNTGKSSLINFLFQDHKSITSRNIGTTTDQLEYIFTLKGEKVTLVDSAGVRKSKKTIERQGISKTLKTMSTENNFILVLSPEISSKNNIKDINKLINKLENKNVVIIFNKADLKQAEQKFKILKTNLQKSQDFFYFVMSCKKDSNNLQKLEELKEILFHKLLKTNHSVKEDIFFSEIRHFNSLERLVEKIKEVETVIEQKEIASNFLDEALLELNNILGRHGSEEELDIIFRKFCIGK